MTIKFHQMSISRYVRTYVHRFIHITLHYIAIHYITLHCIALRCITLHSIALHYIRSHHITLHTIYGWFKLTLTLDRAKGTKRQVMDGDYLLSQVHEVNDNHTIGLLCTVRHEQKQHTLNQDVCVDVFCPTISFAHGD